MTGCEGETSQDADFCCRASVVVRFFLRFDDKQAASYNFDLSTNDKAGFRSPIRRIKKMLEHDKLLVEVTPDRSGPQLTTFTFTGLDEVLTELRSACHW